MYILFVSSQNIYNFPPLSNICILVYTFRYYLFLHSMLSSVYLAYAMNDCSSVDKTKKKYLNDI